MDKGAVLDFTSNAMMCPGPTMPRSESALVEVDRTTGQALHWLRLGGVVREFHDVALLAWARRPMVVGLQTLGPINRPLSHGPNLDKGELLRPGPGHAAG